jgi:alcohol dehydrogenase
MIPSYYEFSCPVKILSGHKALENLPHELAQFNANRPFIITDKGVKSAGLLDHVINAFADSDITIGVIWDDIPPDSSLETVSALAKAYTENHCDAIIAVGGGSVIDSAKGMNIIITEETDDLMQFAGAELLKKPMKAPLIVVPTTAGTGSETTLVAVIADPKHDVKMLFTSSRLYPTTAILDPRMTMTLPAKLTAATGIDALSHAIEGYTCLQKNPMSDAYAWQAIELIRDNLVPVVKNGSDAKRRLNMANAACMAGIAFSNSMVGLMHSLAHATGGVCHLAHGVAINIYMPFVLEYNMAQIGEMVGELLLPFSGAETYASTPNVDRGHRLVADLRILQSELHDLVQLPRTLSEAGVTEEKIPEIAHAAINDGSLSYNPIDLSLSEMEALVKKAY